MLRNIKPNNLQIMHWLPESLYPTLQTHSSPCLHGYTGVQTALAGHDVLLQAPCTTVTA